MKNLFRYIFFLRSKGVQFLIRDDKRASDLKELQVRFEVNLSNRAEHGFQKLCKVISCELDSHKYSNITKKVRGL